MVTIRPVHVPTDRDALLALDRSFTTDRVYRIVRSSHSFSVEEGAAQPPRRKDFPLADDLGDERTWEQGAVAERDGVLLGFAAWTHRRWNRRTELWHFYVAPPARQHGIGRALMEVVTAAAQTAGMRGIWLETSTLAYPAIRFYRRMGFELCGLDGSLYDLENVSAEETALYFYRPLWQASGSP